MNGTNRQEHRKQKGRRYIGVDQGVVEWGLDLLVNRHRAFR